MLKPIRKLTGFAKSNARERHRRSRGQQLISAGERLFAAEDYDNVSVADIAEAAGCSVGAFYGRFPDKDSYLISVIYWRFGWSREAADRDLNANHWRDKPDGEVARQIVEHLASMASGENAGVMRLAVKLGRTNPEALKPMLAYRARVTDLAVDLLAHRLAGDTDGEDAVSRVMQIVQATIMDALLHHQGPLEPSSSTTSEALIDLVVTQLGLSSDETDGRQDSIADDNLDEIAGEEPKARSQKAARMRTNRQSKVRRPRMRVRRI